MRKVNEIGYFNDYISIESISGKRKRFIIRVIFPTKGLYEINL